MPYNLLGTIKKEYIYKLMDGNHSITRVHKTGANRSGPNLKPVGFYLQTEPKNFQPC
jgi:hypothetical protein